MTPRASPAMSAIVYEAVGRVLSPVSRLSIRINRWLRARSARMRSHPWRSPPSPMRSRTGSPSPAVSYATSSSPTRTRAIGRSLGRHLPEVNPSPDAFTRTTASTTILRMHEKFTALTPALYEYLLAHNPPQDEALRALEAETAALGPVSRMQIAREQGAFLTLLARVLGARRAIEIGTFT